MNVIGDVLVVIGVGGMGHAIARRQGPGKTVVVADFNEQTLQTVAESLTGEGHKVIAKLVDVSSHESVAALAQEASALGRVTQVVHTAGLSPAQAPAAAILAVDLVGVALVLDEFGQVVANGGAGVVISSMAGHMLPLHPEQEGRWPALRPTSCWRCRSSAPSPSPIRASLMESQSAPTRFGFRPPVLRGVNAARGSTRSVPGSSRPR